MKHKRIVLLLTVSAIAAWLVTMQVRVSDGNVHRVQQQMMNLQRQVDTIHPQSPVDVVSDADKIAIHTPLGANCKYPRKRQSTIQSFMVDIEPEAHPTDLHQRTFCSDLCQRMYTLSDVYPMFAAHAVEWNLMGKDNAWWSVLVAPEFKDQKDIPLDAKMGFYKSGDQQVNAVVAALPPDAKRKYVLDFGCGLGRLAFPFSHHYDHVSCVDQSLYHLMQASDSWAKRDQLKNDQNMTSYPAADDAVSFFITSPDLIQSVKGRRYDLVHTVIVMQHMMPLLQQAFMEQFCDILNPDGYGWAQIPLWTSKQPKEEACDMELMARQGDMQMHWTPQNYIEDYMAKRGCEVTIKTLPYSNYIGNNWKSGLVMFHKPKSTNSPRPTSGFKHWVGELSKTWQLECDTVAELPCKGGEGEQTW